MVSLSTGKNVNIKFEAWLTVVFCGLDTLAKKKKNEVQSNQEFWQQYNEHVLEDTADLCL